MKNIRKKTVVICNKCNGTGVTYERDYTGDGEYYDCEKCGSSGRLLKIEDIKYEKYDGGIL